jgi:uncharacterized protein (TIGR00369 family)
VREDVRDAVENAPYARRLGVQLDALGEGSLRLVLPFREENTNPGNVLHGGVAASISAIGVKAMARAVLGAAAAPLHVGQIQVAYLAAAREQDVIAEAQLLRRGKTLCFASVGVSTAAGKPIAQALATVCGRFDGEAVALSAAEGDDGAAEPGPLGPHVVKTPFMARLGLRVEHMQRGRSRIVLPASPDNRDVAGYVHEGALLALLDTTGAMAAWAETGPGPYKASTPSLQAQILALPASGDLVAYGSLVQRDGDLFWCDVELADAKGLRVARGTVLYRIVT